MHQVVGLVGVLGRVIHHLSHLCATLHCMRDALVNDLRSAQQAGVCVELTTHTGERYMTGVHDVEWS